MSNTLSLQTNALLDAIMAEFKSNLAHVSWMDEKTRDMARRKLNAMGRKIGYPDYIKDPQALDEHYEKVSDPQALDEHYEKVSDP